MVLLEAALIVGVLGVLLYLTFRLLLPTEQRTPAAVAGSWRVAHYDSKDETRVVLQRIGQGGGKVLDEHVVATIPVGDPEYDEKFLTAMSTARQRQALFESEEGA